MSLIAAKGTYALLLDLPVSTTIQVGKLGFFEFSAGRYVYAGSAFGLGGLAARVGRHQRGSAALRWHIDYLRAQAQVIGVVSAPERLECAWARRLIERGGRVVAAGFGASDCRAGCPAHLLYFVTGLDLSALRAILGIETSCA